VMDRDFHYFYWIFLHLCKLGSGTFHH